MQEVIKNVQLVHNPLTSQEVRSQADRFLYETFFRNESCWEILIQILQTSQLPSELHFFAAQFLRTKMAKNFRQLPSQQLSSLQSLLLDLIKPFAEAPIVLKQMGLAIADFSVQRPDWEDVVKSLVSNLYPDHTLALLNILNCLPEEINSGRIPLAPPQKDAIKHVYQKCAPQVLYFLEKIWKELPENDISNRRLVLECFASWSRVFDKIDANALLNSSLFLSCFQAICVQQTFTYACTALLEIIPISANQDDQHWAAIRNLIIDGIMKLTDPLNQAMQSGDSDGTYHLSRLFIMCTQQFKATLCQRQEDLQQLLMITIEITRREDIHVSQQAYRFWTSLMEDRYEHEYRDKPNPTQGQREMFMAAAREGLKAVIDSIKFPSSFQSFDEEQRDEWYDHRDYGKEVINDLCRYMDPQQFIQVLCEKLQDPLGKWPNSNWQEIEACFYALYQTQGAKNKDTEEVFKQIIDVALQITHNVHMQETITFLLSAYADLPVKYPDMCSHMLKYCLDGLLNSGNKRLTRAAAETLRDVSRFSTDATKKHLETLIDVYTRISKGDANLDSSEICDFVWAICEIFPSIPLEHVCKSMSIMMKQPLEFLEQGLKANDAVKVHLSLKIISEVFRRTKLNDNVIQGSHPLVEGLEGIWVILATVMERYNTNNDIMEKTTRIVKSTIRGASQHFVQSKLAQTILDQIVSTYKSSSKSCFLYLISVYVDEYGQLESTQQLFENCLLQTMEKTSSILTNMDNFTNDPDLVEDFFELLIRYFKRCPHILLKEEYLSHVMDLALRGFRIQHYEASKALLLWIQTMIRQGTDQTNTRDKRRSTSSTAVSSEVVQLIKTILDKMGQQLMTELMHATVNVSYRYLDDYCHIIEAWYQLNTGHLKEFMLAIIQRMAIDPVYPTKQQFVDKYFSFPLNSDRLRVDAVKEFSTACDRFQQTQTYGK